MAGLIEPTTSVIRTSVTSFTFRYGETPASSERSKPVPYPAMYLPARSYRFVASSRPKGPTCVVVCVSETAGNVKKCTPSEETATIASSRYASPELPDRNPFSKTAKSAPGPLAIGVLKPSVIEPPSPSETTLLVSLFAVPRALLGVPNEASGLFGSAISSGPRVIETTDEAHS